jgi:hypothetical protein
VVTPALLVMMAACNTVLGPTRPDSNWRTHETTRFSLYVRPGSFADENAARIGDILDEHYEHARRTLDLSYDGRIAVFLYDSRTDVEPTAPSDTSGVGFPDTEAIAVVCVPPLGDNLAFLLTHEANHVIMNRGIGRPGTSFLNEGMASAVMSSARYPTLGSAVHRWARTHRAQLLPIRDLADDSRWNNFPEEAAYNSSASFLLFLLERYGASPVRALYTVPSKTIEKSVAEIFGRSLEQLEADWLEFLASAGAS